MDLPPFDVLDFKPRHYLEGDGPFVRTIAWRIVMIFGADLFTETHKKQSETIRKKPKAEKEQLIKTSSQKH